MKCCLRTRARHILTLGTRSATMLSISNFRYLSKISFLLIASPHIKTNIYLLLKVVDSKKFFLTRATIASSFVVSLVNFSRI